MTEETIIQLQKAASVVLAPPNAVTLAERQNSEAIFLSFKKAKVSFALYKDILEKCTNDYVLFHVASTIKENVVKEWNVLLPEDIESLRTFLLHYVTQNIGLQNFVREQLLQAVAVIFKRGTIESSLANRENLFNDITQLISTNNLSLQLIACSILTALLNEYSTFGRSSSVGLTWEFHSKCKINFEQNDLKKVFSFCLQVLHELEKVPSPLTREVTVVFNRFLAITEQVLSWEFVSKFNRRHIGSFVMNQNTSCKLPASWKDIVLNEEFLNMMFRIHHKIRYNTEMAHRSLQCLIQLASLNGPIFIDETVKTKYLNSFVHAFLELFSHCQLQDYEALGIASIVNNMMMFFPSAVFMRLPKEPLCNLIQELTKLTCNFGQAAASEEAAQSDDTQYLEAYEKMLQAWMTLHNDDGDTTVVKDILKHNAIEIFNSYLKCHLAAPDGIRNQSHGGGNVSDTEEYEEEDEDDHVKFKDQLSCIGLFGRLEPGYSIPLLARLLEERISRLNGQLNRVQQVQNPTSPLRYDHGSHILNLVNEDLHWLILVTGFVLTDDLEGEVSMIPPEVMYYSIESSKSADIQTTLKVLASPGDAIHSIPGSDKNSDPVVRLCSAILRICEIERRAAEANLAAHLSPQVSASCMWFLQRWVRSYLLPDEKYYAQISPSLSASFGQDTEGSQWTVKFLLDKIVSNIILWCSEADTLNETIELLVAMVENRERTNVVVKCEMMWKLAKDVSLNQPPYDILGSSSKRLLYKALVMVGSASFQDQEKNNYWEVVLNSLQKRFVLITNQPDLRKHFHEESTKLEVQSLLESLCGIAEATMIDTSAIIFNFLYPLLVDCVALLDIYHTYEIIVELILEVFNVITNRQLCYLSIADTQKLYEVNIKIIQTYAKHNIGKRVVTAKKKKVPTATLR